LSIYCPKLLIILPCFLLDSAKEASQNRCLDFEHLAFLTALNRIWNMKFDIFTMQSEIL
jgi:hypothetical protein